MQKMDLNDKQDMKKFTIRGSESAKRKGPALHH